ncbi:ATP phosphoribosyltransferase regulatory subunit [soil metagenome]
MPKWLLPEHISDILPAEAHRIEDLRRALLDMYRSYGYELVMPPLLEYIESLLTGTGHDLELRTFKLVDQLSGRTMGLRADITPQVARIDAHLLNRQGVTRLCYAGSVLHTRPRGLQATREPLQLGAELYGHAGVEADIEIAELALASIAHVGIRRPRVDLSHIGVVDALLADVGIDEATATELVALVQAKDVPGLQAVRGVPAAAAAQLSALCELYGGVDVLETAHRVLPPLPAIEAALARIERLARALPSGRVAVDLGDLRGWRYHSGIMLSVYADEAPAAVARGGRYDEVGLSFGRSRPATGFSLDLRDLAALVSHPAPVSAIRAPWDRDPSLHALIAGLRQAGEIVIQSLPGHEAQSDEFACDRELKPRDGGGWTVVTLDASKLEEMQ